MGTDVDTAVEVQPAEQVAQPKREWVTPEERLMLRFYRQLDQGEQVFMRRAIEAMAK